MSGKKILTTFKQPVLRRLLFLCFLSVILTFAMPACKTEKMSPGEQWLQTGNTHYEAGEYPQALRAWQKALASQPGNINLYRKIGKLYFNQAKYHDALKIYGKLLQKQPEAWDIWLQVARIQLQLLDIAAAEKSYTKCGNKLTNNSENFIFAGDLLAAKVDLAGAEQSYRLALGLDRKNQSALARLAICLLGRHQEKEAEHVYQKLTEQKPCTAEILMQMSHYWQLKNNNKLAESYLIKASKHDVNNNHLQMQLAGFYLETNNQAKAITVYKNILTKTPNNRFVKKMLAETFLTDHQFKKARSLLQSFTESEQKETEVLLLNGKLALFEAAYSDATQVFQELLRKEPDIPIGHYYLALSYLLRGMNNLGQKSLRKALELTPEFSDAELALADAYYQNGNFELAMTHAKRVREKEPENFRAYLLMADIHLARHHYQPASACYRAAQLLYPELNTPAYGLAQTLLATGNPAAAGKTLREILKNEPAVNAMDLYLNSLIKERKQQDAIKTARRYIKKNPGNHYWDYLLGEIQLAAGKKEEAASTFEKVIEYNFATKAAFSKLFSLYQKDDKRLGKTLLKAISKAPEFPEARIKLAERHVKVGQVEKAIAILTEGLATTPDSAALENNLAWIYSEYQPDKINEALRLAQLAYEQKPSSAAIADTLGWIYFKKKMFRRSEWMLKQALSLSPASTETRNHYKVLQKAVQRTPKPVGGAGGVTSGEEPPPPPEESGKNSPSKPASS